MTLLYAPLEPTNPFLGHHYHHHHHQGVPHFRKNPTNCLFFLCFLSRSSTSSWRASVGWLISGNIFLCFFYIFYQDPPPQGVPQLAWSISGNQADSQHFKVQGQSAYCHTAALLHCHTSYFILQRFSLQPILLRYTLPHNSTHLKGQNAYWHTASD